MHAGYLAEIPLYFYARNIQILSHDIIVSSFYSMKVKITWAFSNCAACARRGEAIKALRFGFSMLMKIGSNRKSIDTISIS